MRTTPRIENRFGWFALATILGANAALSQVAPSPSGEIAVVIEGLKSNKGPIQYAFYDSKEAFGKGAAGAVRKGEVSVKDLKCEFVITNVPSGTYALMVGQDLNNNDEIDWAFLGRREPYGVSGYTSSLLWYPSFDKAKFVTREPQTRISIRLH